MSDLVTDPLEAEIIARLRHELRATLGDDHEALVRAEAANVRTFADVASWFVEKVTEDVQQRLHDEFIDTTWPRCPRHQHGGRRPSAARPAGGILTVEPTARS